MEPKSMPKLIKNQCQNWNRERSGKSWKFMFFWKGKTLILSAEHHTVVQNTLREVSCEVNARTWNSSKNHRKWGQNPSQNRCKIYINFILEKGMPKTQKIIQNWARKGAKNRPKSLRKSMSKFDTKKSAKPGYSGSLREPGLSTIQKTPTEGNLRK